MWPSRTPPSNERLLAPLERASKIPAHDELGWTLEPIRTHSTWDGLTSCYAAICEVAGCAGRPYHRALLNALG